MKSSINFKKAYLRSSSIVSKAIERRCAISFKASVYDIVPTCQSVMFVISCAFLLLALSERSFGQEKLRSVQKDKYPQLETPIEVVDVKVNDKALDANESVLAGEDWLKRFKVHFRNKTGKSIIYLRAVLEVAQQGNMRYMLRLPLYFGKMPEPPGSQVGVKAKKPVNMLEDEGAATLNVTDEEYKFFLRQMQENQITDVNRVALVFEFIVFADDTAWSMGHLMRRDPKNPAGWKVVGVWEKDPTEFKAHPSSIASQPCRSISQQEASPPKRAILWRRWNLRGVEAGKENSPAFFAASFFNCN